MIYSKLLEQKMEYKDGLLKCEDGTTYSKKEMSLVKDADDDTKIRIHKIKNAFNGELVCLQLTK